MDAADIVDRYRAGASMLALAERCGTSKHTIRKLLHAAGEPIRPSGRPRLPVSSDTIADLYDAGHSFDDIATRLGIHPDAARTRYHEIRTQRGLTRRNVWHQILLDALHLQPTVAVLPAADTHLGRRPTSNEAHAARRAARDLARAGEATLDHRTLTWRERTTRYLVLTRRPAS